MVAIGRALMSAPNILLLDEPSLGLSPLLCDELFQALARIRETGVGMLLVEQNARQSLNIADRGYLIETGRIVGQGTAQCAAERSGGAARLSRRGRGSRRPGAAVSDGGTNENDRAGDDHEQRQSDDRRSRRRRRRRPHLRPRSIRSPARSRRARRRHRSRDAIAAADAAAAAFPAWSALGPSAAACNAARRPPTCSTASGDEFAEHHDRRVSARPATGGISTRTSPPA